MMNIRKELKRKGMRNKSNFIGLLVMLLTTASFIVWLVLVFIGDIDFSKDALWFLLPFSYGAWMFLDDDDDIIKQHIKLFNAAISVFKRKT